MNNSNLAMIASVLGDLYQERQQVGLRTWQIEAYLAARKVFLTPADGWPGKNAELREVEASRAFAQDGACQEMAEALNDLRENAADIAGQVEALEAQRRALEWGIRERLAEALSGKANGHGDVAESAFDDGLQAAVDSRQMREIMDSRLYDEMVEDLRRMPEQPAHIGPEDVSDLVNPGYDEYRQDLAAAAELSQELPF